MRRPSVVLCLCLLAVFALSAGVADAAGPKALTFDVKTGPNNDIDCTITADLYTPDGVSKANPAPAVMGTNGFGGSKADFATLATSYAKRGYVFLAYSGLGFGGSGCKIELDDPDYDGKAGSQLISFLGGSKAATDGTKIDYVMHDARSHDGVARADDPRVGMIGGSYGGQIQFAIAGLDPRLDTIVPQITWNDLSYSLTPNNTDFTHGVTYGTPGVSKLDWPVLFTGLGVGQGIQHAFTDQDPSHVGACPNFDDRVCPGLVMSGSTGYPDATTLAFLRHASVSTYMSHIRIPTFLAQGENDTLFDLQEAAATYRDLRAQGTPVKMLWRSAGHSGGDIGNSENDEAEPEAGYESRLELEWLDYYLRGIGDGPPLDFSFFRDWQPYTGDAAPAVGETPNYPASTETTLYLSGTDALVGKPADVKPGSAAMAAVPGALTSTGGGFADLGATDAPGTSVTFTTPALAADIDVAGPPRVKVHLSAPTFAQSQSADPATKLVVFAKLYDLDPSGAATLPANLVSAARVADVTKPVDIELPGIVHHFVKGHQMQLVLTTSDATFNGNHFAGPVSVTVDPASQSTLIIPELGEQLGATGAGPSGTTRFTPPADDGPVQKPGAGGPEPAAQAAVLPSAATCKSRRSFRIRLRKAPKGDRLKSAVVTVNGKRVKAVRGKRLKAPVDLRGLPKGTFRVVITARTVRGRTLRSARTYRTCVAKRK